MRFLTTEEIEDLDSVRQIITDTGIKARILERLPGGARSFAFGADNLCIRFPKAEVIWKTMQREKQIIDAVYPHIDEKLPGRVHKIELIAEEYPFSVSKRFSGKICDNRGEGEYTTGYTALSGLQQENLARQVAKFFAGMHAIDYETLNIPPVDGEIAGAMESWNVSKRPDYDHDEVKSALMKYSADKLNLDDFNSEKTEVIEALCHNDLSGSNMLIEPDSYQLLNGVIDFGNARIVPIAEDFFPLYKVDRKLAIDTLKIYNKIVTHPLSQITIDNIALQYIGYGLAKSTGDPQPYFLRLLQMFLRDE